MGTQAGRSLNSVGSREPLEDSENHPDPVTTFLQYTFKTVSE